MYNKLLCMKKLLLFLVSATLGFGASAQCTADYDFGDVGFGVSPDPQLGESFEVGTSSYTTSGAYTDVLTSINGCDSTVNLALTVHPVYTIDLVEEICEGESYEVGTSSYNTTGTYTDVLTTINGCDSTVNLALTVHPVYTLDSVAVICQGESVTIGTRVYTTSGTYSDLLRTVEGCDSTVNLSLTVHPTYVVDVVEEICQAIQRTMPVWVASGIEPISPQA